MALLMGLRGFLANAKVERGRKPVLHLFVPGEFRPPDVAAGEMMNLERPHFRSRFLVSYTFGQEAPQLLDDFGVQE